MWNKVDQQRQQVIAPLRTSPNKFVKFVYSRYFLKNKPNIHWRKACVLRLTSLWAVFPLFEGMTACVVEAWCDALHNWAPRAHLFRLHFESEIVAVNNAVLWMRYIILFSHIYPKMWRIFAEIIGKPVSRKNAAVHRFLIWINIYSGLKYTTNMNISEDLFKSVYKLYTGENTADDKVLLQNKHQCQGSSVYDIRITHHSGISRSCRYVRTEKSSSAGYPYSGRRCMSPSADGWTHISGHKLTF